MSNATKPVFIATVTGDKVEVNKKLADVRDQSRMKDWFADAVHSLTNNTFRECGLECEGSTSEMTFDIAREFSNDVMATIARRIDEERERLVNANRATEALIKTKKEQLADALATVERLKKELGVEQSG